MSEIDLSKVTNPEAKRFLRAFFGDRQINKDFYQLVPEDKFDYHMVDTPERKSDSPRESLAHQVDTTRDYINGIKTGALTFGAKYEDLVNPTALTKEKLLAKLTETEKELIKLLADSGIADKKVKVPWSQEPIPAIASLWGLDSHEILHTGWNLALMDHLGIPRFPSLQGMWGR